MAEVIATVQRAAQWVGDGPGATAPWNPVYRALVDDAGAPPPRSPAVESTGADGADLVRRQLTAPALLVVAVTAGERTRRLRIGLDPAGATVERAEDDDASRWTELEVAEVPTTVADLLEESGIDLAPARLEIADDDALRLTPEQTRLAQAALADGVPAEEALATLPGLDPALQDALTAAGPRLSLSLSLHDPDRQVAEAPVSWSRLWVTGRSGMYRMDAPGSEPLTVRPVGGGDVLGTLLPILEQGLRFAAETSTPGGAR
ncbi:hypothetical protein [Brachybacterium saurashtrense]|uniref:ESX secretion-associated protein EspG n=1 Tax=Brachybacterium saurashtrense TaxID=556288 RepID=A0A345YKU1_9MICO|nr:hypothetical protein [Brachybacterium saurashtrense]AXK44543.1 hypothetical protein DWV08_02175 [Brachybacterium saurashtrense]RRR23155.1 hypothetical protein DXU92_07305 [Brachybacterium saurashtrense]